MIHFTAFGIPQTAGSKRAFAFKRRNGNLGVSVSDDNPKGKDWKAVVAHAAREVYHGDLLDGPLAVTFVFYFPRPKGHFGKRGLLASAPQHHAKKPDALKLARCAEDALTQVVWRDDAQIVSEVLVKKFGEPARVEVTIEPVGMSPIVDEVRSVEQRLF